MALIIVGTEKSFTQLRSRIFAGESVSTKVSREVSEAIAAANPGVDLKKLEPGTVIEVPDHPKVNVQGEVSLPETTKEVLTGIVNTGTQDLAQLVASARELEASAASDRKRLTATLSGTQLAEAGRGDKALGADLAAAQQAVAAEDDAAAARTQALLQAQSEWNAELKALLSFVP
jgi:hypothetical protein